MKNKLAKQSIINQPVSQPNKHTDRNTNNKKVTEQLPDNEEAWPEWALLYQECIRSACPDVQAIDFRELRPVRSRVPSPQKINATHQALFQNQSPGSPGNALNLSGPSFNALLAGSGGGNGDDGEEKQAESSRKGMSSSANERKASGSNLSPRYPDYSLGATPISDPLSASSNSRSRSRLRFSPAFQGVYLSRTNKRSNERTS